VTAGEFEQVVHHHHANLYWFALALARNEDEARDLTQQTFYIWARKSHQVREPSRLRSWLLTTLHREFLGRRRRKLRFPEVEWTSLDETAAELTVEAVDKMDAQSVMHALGELEEPFRAPLALFYLEDLSYKEISELLGIPLGTVMSRISRAKERLRQIVSGLAGDSSPRVSENPEVVPGGKRNG
jgi:RNA polymerase sigma-70 factor, ECF subfamily